MASFCASCENAMLSRAEERHEELKEYAQTAKLIFTIGLNFSFVRHRNICSVLGGAREDYF